MKITYTPNPLETQIELDEHEKRDLWHKIRFDEMEELLSEVHHILTNLEWFNKTTAPRSLSGLPMTAARATAGCWIRQLSTSAGPIR
jgi:hypothetical protein